MTKFNGTKSQLTIIAEHSALPLMDQELGHKLLRGNIHVSVEPWLQGNGFLTSTRANRQAKHLLSDGLFFVATTLNDLLELYWAWLADWDKSAANDELKPRGFLFLLGERHITTDLLSLHCTHRVDSEDQDGIELEQRAFEKLVSVPESTTGPSYELMRLVADTARSSRARHGMLWSNEELDTVLSAFTSCAESGHPHTFSIAKTITHRHPSLGKKGNIASVLMSGASKGILEQTIVPLLASYLVCHGRRSPHWSNMQSAALKQGAKFATYHFQQQYFNEVRDLLAAHFDLLELELECLLLKLRHQWSDILIEGVALQDRASFTTLHLERIGRHQRYLCSRPYRFECVGCLAGAWDRLLACNQHGLCNVCIQDTSTSRCLSDFVNLPLCCICKQPKSMTSVPFEGPGARCRVLALDGGGVGGLRQLAILKMLQKEMGEGFDVCDFFDLIVGTSVGGIIALGLGVKEWSIDKCREKFIYFCKSIFSRKTRLGTVTSKLTLGWSDSFHKVARVAMNGGLYSGEASDAIFKESFGEHEPLMQSRKMRVAVTATGETRPFCQLLTTYNKSHHDPEVAYSWPQQHEDVASWKLWKAARCTSAAPWYFAPFTSMIGLLQDGGLSYVMPAGIANREATKLYNSSAAENLKVSVGCGETLLPSHSSSLFGRACSYLMWKTCPASEEEVRTLWDQDLHNYFRLDPKVEGKSIPLDDIDAMLASLPQLEMCISKDHEFGEHVQACAWRLIASNWYCGLASPCRHDGEQSDHVKIEIRSRNEKNSRLVNQNYPDAYFHVHPSSNVLPLTSDASTFSISLGDEKSEVNIELVHRGRRSPISGLPMTVGHLMKVLDVHVQRISKKRKAEEASHTGKANKAPTPSKSY